jgi:hypothetical protein
MPTSLFDLPRELRDIIYAQVLVSPTGFLCPSIVAKGDPQSSRPVHFILIVSEPSTMIFAKDPPSVEDGIVSLSLIRTNRQIYQETSGLFWARNTFNFRSVFSIPEILKEMGQLVTQKITSVSIDLWFSPRGESNPSGREVLKNLILSMQRLSLRHCCPSLRRMRMDVNFMEFFMLPFLRETEGELFEAVLLALKAVASPRYQNVLVVQMDSRTKIPGTSEHDALRDLHLAWGGTTYCNCELEWVDSAHVGLCDGRPTIARHYGQLYIRKRVR